MIIPTTTGYKWHVVNFRCFFDKEEVEIREKIHDMISGAKHKLFNGVLGFRWFQVFAEIGAPKEHT